MSYLINIIALESKPIVWPSICVKTASLTASLIGGLQLFLAEKKLNPPHTVLKGKITYID